MRVSVPFRLFVYLLIGGACWVPTAMSGTTDNTELEATVRALVRANSEKDLSAMSKLMAHDAISSAIPSGAENTWAGQTLNAI